MDPGFFADPYPGFKIRISPLTNLWDLNDGFDKVLEALDQKGQCGECLIRKKFVFYLFLQFLDFFCIDPDPDFYGSDPDF